MGIIESKDNAWYINGFLRPNLRGAIDPEDGDRIWTNSNREWHREDGPAYIYNDGSARYYIKDIAYTKADWLDYIKSDKSSLDQKTINRVILENS